MRKVYNWEHPSDKPNASMPSLSFDKTVYDINLGESLTLSVNATIKGEGTLSYDWFDLTNGYDEYLTSTESLVLSNLTKGTHKYKVQVTNTLGDTHNTAVSEIITVNVGDSHINKTFDKSDVSLNKNEFTFTGLPQTPIITITTMDGILTSNDYKVEFSGDLTNVGLKTFIIVGINDYEGVRIEFTYSITQAENNISNFELDDENNITINSLFGSLDVVLKYYASEFDEYINNITKEEALSLDKYYVRAFIPGNLNYKDCYSKNAIEFIKASEIVKNYKNDLVNYINELNEKIGDLDSYTFNSKNNYQSVLSSIDEILDKGLVTLDEFNDSKVLLDEAVKGLVLRATDNEMVNLQAKIDEFKNIMSESNDNNNGTYMSSLYNAKKDAYNDLLLAYKKGNNLTKVEYDKVIKAYDEITLVKCGNSSELINAINNYIKEFGNTYINSKWIIAKTSLNAIKDKLSVSTEMTLEEVEALIVQFEEVKSGLVGFERLTNEQITVLENKLAHFKEQNKDLYTINSFDNLIIAKNKIDKALENGGIDTLKTVYDELVNEYDLAFKKLVLRATDKDLINLQEKINEFEQIMELSNDNQDGMYTKTSYQNKKNAYNDLVLAYAKGKNLAKADYEKNIKAYDIVILVKCGDTLDLINSIDKFIQEHNNTYINSKWANALNSLNNIKKQLEEATEMPLEEVEKLELEFEEVKNSLVGFERLTSEQITALENKLANFNEKNQDLYTIDSFSALNDVKSRIDEALLNGGINTLKTVYDELISDYEAREQELVIRATDEDLLNLQDKIEEFEQIKSESNDNKNKTYTTTSYQNKKEAYDDLVLANAKGENLSKVEYDKIIKAYNDITLIKCGDTNELISSIKAFIKDNSNIYINSKWAIALDTLNDIKEQLESNLELTLEEVEKLELEFEKVKKSLIGFERLTPEQITDLENKLANFNEKNNDLYTIDSFNSLNEVKTRIDEALLNDGINTLKTVYDDLIKDYEEKEQALVIRATDDDLINLQSKIDEFEQIKESSNDNQTGKYTKDSYQSKKETYDELVNVLKKDKNLSKVEYDKIINAYNDIILVECGNTSDLIDQIEKFINDNNEVYINNKWINVVKSLNEIKDKLINSSEMTLEEVKVLEKEFNEIKESLVGFERLTKEQITTLENILTNYKEMNKDLYTINSIDPLNNAIKNVEKALIDDGINTLKTVYDDLVKEYDLALKGLVIRATDKELANLQEKINEFEKIKSESNDNISGTYTTSSYQNKKNAYNNLVSSQSKGKNLTKEEYDEVINAYDSIVLEKVEKPVESYNNDLHDYINEMEKNDISSYPEEKQNIFKDAIKKAKEKANGEPITKEEYETIKNEIKLAFDNLSASNNADDEPTSVLPIVLGAITSIGILAVIVVIIVLLRREQKGSRR